MVHKIDWKLKDIVKPNDMNRIEQNQKTLSENKLGKADLANNLETEIAGVAPLDAVMGKELNDKINEMIGVPYLEHFTKFPSDMWNGKITYHRIWGSLQGEYDPLPNDTRPYHYNVITYGEARRCSQIAIQVYYSQNHLNAYDTKGFYIRTQHDSSVSKWTRIVTSDDSETLIPQEILQLQNGFEFWDDLKYGTISRTGNIVHINFLLKAGKGTSASTICKLPYIPARFEIHPIKIKDRVIEIRTFNDGTLNLNSGVPTMEEAGSGYFCVDLSYVCV